MTANTPIVLELQRLASDKNNDVTDLLRKALMVATKLDLTEFRNWLNRELKGYGPDDVVPQYRMAQAEMHVNNPFKGLQPLLLPQDMQFLLDIELRVQIENIVQLVQNNTYGTVPLPDEMKIALMQGMRSIGGFGSNIPLEPIRTINLVFLVRVLDSVRTAILEWALELEKQGIVGHGLTFTENDKAKAAENRQVFIQNFNGIYGDVSHSKVEQHISVNVNKGDFDSLAKHLSKEGVKTDDISSLKAAIEADVGKPNTGKYGKNVGAWMGKMIEKAVSGAWSVSLDVASSVLASAIAHYYGFN